MLVERSNLATCIIQQNISTFCALILIVSSIYLYTYCNAAEQSVYWI